MNKSWEAVEFVTYLRSRWRIAVIACACASILTLVVSLALPKRYTATVVISIDPPSGNDVRMATAVSPVYLESLKGYEHIAASDSLFALAVDKFHLKDAGSSEAIESLKRRVLKISKIRDTRILEISATLSDARIAHQLAAYIAEQTVRTTLDESLAGDRDRTVKIEHQLAEARIRLEKTSKDSGASSTSSTIGAIESRNDADQELLAKLRQELAEIEADEAEYSTNSGKTDGEASGNRATAAHARAGVLKAALAQLEREIAANQIRIDGASSRREVAEAELNVARSEYEGISNRLLDLEASAGSGGERLRIVDPGIVPQRPSFPATTLNVALALASALIGSTGYIALTFSYERRRVEETLFR